MVSLTKSNIISAFIQAILYGFAVLMFVLTMWIHRGNRRQHPQNYTMIAASCALLILSTTEMGVNFARIYQGFITVGPQTSGGPEAYFGHISHPTFILKSCLYQAQTLIIDGVVVYRAYIVWQNAYVLVLPALCWCGFLVGAIGSNIALAVGGGSGLPFPWITAIYVLDFVTNLTSTALLAYRLWAVSRGAAKFRLGHGLAPVLRVVIESGAIYSATVAVGMILFILRSNAVYIMIDMASPVGSIVFNMIVVRLGLAQERAGDHCPNAPRSASTSTSFVAVVAPAVAQDRDTRKQTPPDEVELGDAAATVKITSLFDYEGPDVDGGEESDGRRSGEDRQRDTKVLAGVKDKSIDVVHV